MPHDHLKCPVGGCSNAKASYQVMCKTDWRKVPKPLQTEIWLHYRTDRGSREHLVAVARAIELVEEMRGPCQMRLLDVDR